jgi:3D (Asp-Asp-Asp) domain-containing protein
MLFVGGLCLVFIGLMLPTEAKEKKKAKRYEAEFTGYYPDDSEMEGGYYAATGVLLDPSAYTVAAPKCIPFGAKITVGGTGNKRDGWTYRVNDRGGRIVVDEDGLYHIDILMRNARQANNFGRVRGWIEVE